MTGQAVNVDGGLVMGTGGDGVHWDVSNQE
jgi:hypothetical protein